MAINVAKTKFIVFRTRGKVMNPLDCQLVYNSNEIGLPENQALVYPIETIHNEGETKNFKLLGVAGAAQESSKSSPSIVELLRQFLYVLVSSFLDAVVFTSINLRPLNWCII